MNLHSQVLQIDTAFSEVVEPSTKIEKLAGGFGFTEGPVWVHQGYLLFSDIPRSVIRKWTPDGTVSDFPSAGVRNSNGLTLDRKGWLTICEHGNRRVSQLDGRGRLTVLVDRFEGKRLNSPNDLVYKSDGSLYFTDPPYGLAKLEEDPARELPFNGIYRLARGRLQLLNKDMTRPNGLAFSPDEKYLYVANSDRARKVWIRFEVRRNGQLGASGVFFDVTARPEEGSPDGLKVDKKGNLYCTGPGGIWIFSKDGKHLGTILTPEVPANCHWGDRDGKALYITARTGLYRLRTKVAGIRP